MAKPRGYAAEDVLDEHGNTKHDKSLPVTLGISSRPEWNEYVVFWKEGKKILDGPSDHIDRSDPDAGQDAVQSLLNKFQYAQKAGYNVTISQSKLVKKLLESYKGPNPESVEIIKSVPGGQTPRCFMSMGPGYDEFEKHMDGEPEMEDTEYRRSKQQYLRDHPDAKCK